MTVSTIRAGIIGVFRETDECHPKMKLIFEALFWYFSSMAISFHLEISNPAMEVIVEINPALNILRKVFTRNFNKTNFNWFL